MTQNNLFYANIPLSADNLGDNIPRRKQPRMVRFFRYFLKILRWKTIGQIPNIPKAVFIGVPHTSNLDGLYGIPAWLSLDLDLKVLGKKQLFKIPLLKNFLHWAGVIPIDRSRKGSVLQANIDRFNNSQQLFLALAPEGTRHYSEQWKTGFYYLALGSNVPIIPVAIDYKTKEIRFMNAFHPTGDLEKDLNDLYQYFKDVYPKHFSRMSQPLQDLHKK